MSRSFTIGRSPALLEPFAPATFTAIGSVTHSMVLAASHDEAIAAIASSVTITISNWAIVALLLSALYGEPVPAILRRNFTLAWFGAFTYFALAGILMGELLDGSLRGYVLATIVCLLSLALTDTIAGRRTRSMLEEQLTDADRHLIYSRALEGVVHDLRNYVGTIQGYLEEVHTAKLPDQDREDIEVAKAASADAAELLRNLSAGASPKVSYAADPVDLSVIANQAVALVRIKARQRHTLIDTTAAGRPALTRGDPILLREVTSNLLLNAIDAAGEGGRVRVSVGARDGDQVYISVSDSGPGVPDAIRSRLFEPHFTTKPSGSGMGLFSSFGIVREHQGELLYEGTPRRGAVFTLVLPRHRPAAAPPAHRS